jgi:hypothetical protein
MVSTLETCSHKEECTVIWFLWIKYVSPTKIHGSVTEMCGNGVMSMQQVRKWCRVFKSGWTDIMMVTSVDSANKEELILENLQVTIQDLSTAMEVPM